MKHLKRFNETTSYLENIRKNKDLEDIIYFIQNSDIPDEFPYIRISDWYDSKMNDCLKNNLKDNNITPNDYEYLKNNSFTIELSESSELSEVQPNDNQVMINWTIPEPIYWIEPKIHQIIKDINHRLNSIGFQIIMSDFGSTDATYELVICDKDFELKRVD